MAPSSHRAGARQGYRNFERTLVHLFVVPYALLFLFFIAYPVVSGAIIGSDADAYKRLFDERLYWRAVWNTILFVFFGANIKMLIALYLSGFLARRGWLIGVISAIFLLPWALPHVPAILSISWLLNTDYGWFNVLLFDLFGIVGPSWLASPDTAFAAIIGTHIWKYLPFWTMILVAGRLAIDHSLYEAAAMDGATSWQMFSHITFPQIRGLFVTSTLLTMIWTVGDFNSVYLLTGGGPYDRTHTLATLGIEYAFEEGNMALGIATVISALPFLLPIVYLLLRRINRPA